MLYIKRHFGHRSFFDSRWLNFLLNNTRAHGIGFLLSSHHCSSHCTRIFGDFYQHLYRRLSAGGQMKRAWRTKRERVRQTTDREELNVLYRICLYFPTVIQLFGLNSTSNILFLFCWLYACLSFLFSFQWSRPLRNFGSALPLTTRTLFIGERFF